MKRVFFTSVLLLAFVAVGSALYLDPTVPCPPGSPRCPRTWTYKNATSWGAQCPQWAKCSESARQSPIDVTSQPLWSGWQPRHLNFKYGYLKNTTYIFNTGNYYVLPVNPRETPQTFELNGVKYYLTRIEFHSPSQHLLNGKRFDVEAQLFHAGGSPGKTVAISVFFSRSSKAQTNAFIDKWVWKIPEFCTCVDQSCPKPVCGNGIAEGTESCDNGTRNSNSADACRLDCCLPSCGDNIKDSNEECDDGNNQNGDGCSSVCVKECGNGVVNPALEQCDTGRNNSDSTPNACRTNCRRPTCGDNVVDRGEGCDSLFGTNPGQCRTNCTAPVCGDGLTDPNEECDYAGMNGDGFYCLKNCSCACGNGKIELQEDCDLSGTNNNQNPNAGCRGSCHARRCGDGIIDDQFGEECDSIYFEDGEAIGNIYCTTDCKLRCGNDIVEEGEQCDDGIYNGQGNSNCSYSCTWAYCGDGIVSPGEECDNGAANSNSTANACRVNCRLPRCGDGVVDRGEVCDSTPGCTNVCLPLCGNGFVDAGEECDYGWGNNNNQPDNCRPNCKLPKCGDGIKDTLEQCDSNSNGNTPNSCRADCTKPYCGDGITDSQFGELCDAGKANSEVNPFGCSTTCIPNSCNSRALGTAVDLSLALPHNQTAYAYSGSWTHPPCSDNVQWIIFGEVQDLTQAQFASLTGQPCTLSAPRPVQPLAGRAVSILADPPAALCGNGMQQGNEECDLGLRNSDWEANKCRTNCKKAGCGDGVTDRGEECDDGLGSSRCTSLCTLVPVRRNPYAAPHWSYSNTCKWSMLRSGWSSCASERPSSTQSPINIDTIALHHEATGLFKLDTQYTETQGSLYNTGRVIALTTPGNGNVLSQAGKSLFLRRVEFHSPSEHTLNGYHADLEAVFLHSSDDGMQASVSVLYNVSHRANDFLDQFWFSIPQDSHCSCGNGVVDKGEACDDGHANSDSHPGACRTNCMLYRCGDGIVDRGEECDEMATRNVSNKCRTNCRLPFCGDGIVDGALGEQCDYNNPTGPACDKTCHLFCGNGLVEAHHGEDCDEGEWNSDSTPNHCNSDCTKSHCGDGTIDNGEECDDGALNSNSNSYCRKGCTLPICGDGIVDSAFGEECDSGRNNTNGSYCLPNCKLNCGSGLKFNNTYKECDDGPLNSNEDGANCRTNCKSAMCGDEIVDYSKGEQCDDGPRGSATCTSNCKLLCGNGVLEKGEECDHGVNNDDTTPNCCRTTCEMPKCGDGVKDANEACDFGRENSNSPNSACRRNCVLPKCGDRIVDSEYEECDDGNTVNGDGCSSTCRSECGNGRRDGNEQCDNGDLNSDSVPGACRSDCSLPKCGDKTVDHGEQCDSGANSNTPNSCRSDCTLPVCGDGIVDSYYGEKCDEGANNNDFSGSCSTDCYPNSCRMTSAGRVSLQGIWDKTSPVVAYRGSLSSPPCTEGVSVYVFEKVQPLSKHQLEHFTHALGSENARGVQPLHSRTVSYTKVAPTLCGDCKVQGDEECDNGENNGEEKDKCRRDCKKPKCGDGIVDSGEECDNGRANSEKGLCSPQCKLITTCPSSPCMGAPCGVQAPAAKCPCAAQEMNNSGTIININFANLLRGAGCGAN